MAFLASLLEFLIIVVGIVMMIGILCVILPLIYLILSFICYPIKLKFRPEPEPPPPKPAILLSPGPFYLGGLPSSSQHRIFCLLPYDSDADVDFDEFTMSFLRRTFRSSPFIVEQVQSTRDDDRFPLKDEDFVIEFKQKGGWVFFRDKCTLLAVTTPQLPRLYDFMDRFDEYTLFYDIFELPAPLSPEQLSEPGFDLRHTDFTCSMSVNQEPGHKYIQIETQRNFSSFIASLWELCRRMGRELVLSPEDPGKNNAAQS